MKGYWLVLFVAAAVLGNTNVDVCGIPFTDCQTMDCTRYERSEYEDFVIDMGGAKNGWKCFGCKGPENFPFEKSTHFMSPTNTKITGQNDIPKSCSYDRINGFLRTRSEKIIVIPTTRLLTEKQRKEETEKKIEREKVDKYALQKCHNIGKDFGNDMVYVSVCSAVDLNKCEKAYTFRSLGHSYSCFGCKLSKDSDKCIAPSSKDPNYRIQKYEEMKKESSL
jgi:hypothetical protein